ncbi:glycoside hydrolase family 2 protein [Microbacterium testaceum]|uniref:glycoside hydrolase family 2 protein n=1 Tax=Microbacterium testaceum TaxID=2033 RepID=UPI000734E4EC|nr:beta-mannosidase [Microbacterium testaceum]
MYHPLDAGWTLTLLRGERPDEDGALDDGIPAAVPGVVHTDLLAAGLMDDPFPGAQEEKLAWIGESDWRYRTTFSWSRPLDSARVDLVAEGLDTVATVRVNGATVLETANQHRGYRTDLTPVLREGENTVEVDFRSPVRYAREREAVLGERPHSYAHPFNAIRKSACNFGWDWGPDFATAGIWRPIGLQEWTRARIAAVRPVVDIVDGIPHLTAHVELEWQHEEGEPTTVQIEVAGASARVEARPGQPVVIDLAVPDAEPWWPRGYGEARLYDLTVRVGDGADEATRWSRAIGFRHVEVDIAPDEHGSPFTVRINGRDVYVHGANWIPDDVFVTRITPESLAASIADATDAGLNLLRVWGGGLYESDDFYDICDREGVLVWQDFLLACAAYSEDAELWDEFEAEAREAVTRLSRHPSLVIFNGGNENIWGYVDWTWRSRLNGRSWGEGYYRDLFPRIVAELAPTTFYSDGSPFSFSSYVHPNDDAHGTMHIWDVWNTRDYDGYRAYRPRFVSEFGFQGPPAFSTLESVVRDEPRSPFGREMLAHQKANEGNDKLARGLGTHLPEPGGYTDWHWTMQLNQARAVSFGIEWFRSLFPLNRGWIVWQLNDCWPVVSWAAVDSHRHRKPLWYELRRVSAPRLLTIQPELEGDGLRVTLHNDSDEAISGRVELRREGLEGGVLASATLDLEVEPRSSWTATVDPALATAIEPEREVLVAHATTGERGLHYFVDDTELALEDDISTHARAVDGGYEVTVTARTLVKDATLLADLVEPTARADSGMITLTAGEEHVFRITAPAGLDPAAFADARVLRTTNDLLARARER